MSIQANKLSPEKEEKTQDQPHRATGFTQYVHNNLEKNQGFVGKSITTN